MGYNLFLDDVRSPYRDMGYMKYRGVVGVYQDIEWVIIRNFEEFKEAIDTNGIPNIISYDHDLGDEQYHPSMYEGQEAYEAVATQFTEKTGKECVEYLISKLEGSPHPRYIIHSQNPVGVQRIEQVIEWYNKNGRLTSSS